MNGAGRFKRAWKARIALCRPQELRIYLGSKRVDMVLTLKMASFSLFLCSAALVCGVSGLGY